MVSYMGCVLKHVEVRYFVSGLEYTRSIKYVAQTRKSLLDFS